MAMACPHTNDTVKPVHLLILMRDFALYPLVDKDKKIPYTNRDD